MFEAFEQYVYDCTHHFVDCVGCRRLSELLCFVRSDIIELFRATPEDIKGRNRYVNNRMFGLVVESLCVFLVAHTDLDLLMFPAGKRSN